MAYDKDPNFHMPLRRRLFFKLNGPAIVNRWRAKKRARLGVSEVEASVAFDSDTVAAECFSVDWDSARAHFAEHGWCFCDPFLEPGFYARVRADWPDRVFLIPPRKIDKWYNTGFNWMKNGVHPRYLENHRGIEALIKGLGAEAFLSRLSELAGCSMELTEFHVTDSSQGAEVPMHLDSLLKGEHGEKAIGIAIFVDGTGGERSGGLCVSDSSGWRDVIFEPTSLRNTALIYSKKLHHGFLPIERGKFRHSINTQFWPAGSQEG